MLTIVSRRITWRLRMTMRGWAKIGLCRSSSPFPLSLFRMSLSPFIHSSTGGEPADPAFAMSREVLDAKLK